MYSSLCLQIPHKLHLLITLDALQLFPFPMHQQIPLHHIPTRGGYGIVMCVLVLVDSLDDAGLLIVVEF